jgi:hypothetical protein
MLFIRTNAAAPISSTQDHLTRTIRYQLYLLIDNLNDKNIKNINFAYNIDSCIQR